jgi:hypothetical protein
MLTTGLLDDRLRCACCFKLLNKLRLIMLTNTKLIIRPTLARLYEFFSSAALLTEDSVRPFIRADRYSKYWSISSNISGQNSGSSPSVFL